MTTAVSARPIRVLAGGLGLALLGWATPTMAQVDVEERERTAELELVAATIWQAVMTRDLETLLRYVRPETLEDTRRRLTMADSGLACALFDTRCLEGHLPPGETRRTSIVDFFRRQPGARLRVTYLGMAMFGLESPLDLAMVTWVVPGSRASMSSTIRVGDNLIPTIESPGLRYSTGAMRWSIESINKGTAGKSCSRYFP